LQAVRVRPVAAAVVCAGRLNKDEAAFASSLATMSSVCSGLVFCQAAVHHRPGRQQPAPQLLRIGGGDHPIHQLRPERPGQRPTDTRSGNHPSGDTAADPSCATL